MQYVDSLLNELPLCTVLCEITIVNLVDVPLQRNDVQRRRLKITNSWRETSQNRYADAVVGLSRVRCGREDVNDIKWMPDLIAQGRSVPERAG